MDAKRTLSAVEREALLMRHNAAMRVLRTDPELTPYEALLMVVRPSPELREITETEAARRLGMCSRCMGDTDADGYCSFCGAVTVGV